VINLIKHTLFPLKRKLYQILVTEEIEDDFHPAYHRGYLAGFAVGSSHITVGSKKPEKDIRWRRDPAFPKQEPYPTK
jgi:hypothetical protein